MEQRFGVTVGFSEGTKRFNIAPSEQVVGVVLDEAGQTVARALRWGLIPSWAKDAKIGYKMINARSETVNEKPAYRALIGNASRRALLPADGFYEWLRSEDPKQPRQPFRFTVDDGSLFALAALWTPSVIDGESGATVSILTTQANRVVARLHDRMPVILADRASELAWLDSALDAAGASALCRPLDPERMHVAPASTAVNKAGGPEGVELLRA